MLFEKKGALDGWQGMCSRSQPKICWEDILNREVGERVLPTPYHAQGLQRCMAHHPPGAHVPARGLWGFKEVSEVKRGFEEGSKCSTVT